MVDPSAWGRGAVCVDAAQDTLMQDGNEPCEPHLPGAAAPVSAPRALRLHPRPADQSAMEQPHPRPIGEPGLHSGAPSFQFLCSSTQLIPLAERHLADGPFRVGNSFTYISKARVRRRSFPGEEKALLSSRDKVSCHPAPAGVEQLTCSQHTTSGAVLGEGATPVCFL